MNNKIIEEKKRLNKTFEIIDKTFEKYDLQLIGKGIDIRDTYTNVLVELLINDKSKIPDDGLTIKVSMYDSDGSILFHDEEYLEKDYLDDLYSSEILLSNVTLENLNDVDKIRIYIEKAR